MPDGKKAGERCVHLSGKNGCLIFGKPERPGICAGFMPERSICGESREEALRILTDLEFQTM